tara:strand:+ start:3723 stop:4835 length:1113 start_codon:yes stop_codon:yes gene_type:complete
MRESIIKRYQGWELNGQGQISGLWPVPDGHKPDEFVELSFDRKTKYVNAIKEWIADHPRPLERQPKLNAKGQIQYSDFINPIDGVNGRNSYKYDSRGFLAARQEEDEHGRLRFRTLTKCDARGRFVEEKAFDEKGILKERHLFVYDDDDHLIKDTRFDGPQGESAAGFYTYAYDLQSHLTRRVWHDSQGQPKSTFIYRYDEYDRLTAISINREGHMLLTTEIKFDGEGKKAGSVVVNSDGETISTQERSPMEGFRKSRYGLPPVQGEHSNFAPLSKEQIDAATTVAYHHFENKRYKEAQELFKTITYSAPANVYALNGVAACALKRGQLEMALNWFEKALKEDSEYKESQMGKEHVLKALKERENALSRD